MIALTQLIASAISAMTDRKLLNVDEKFLIGLFSVSSWGSKFGTELWESVTIATRRDEIQKVMCEGGSEVHG